MTTKVSCVYMATVHLLLGPGLIYEYVGILVGILKPFWVSTVMSHEENGTA